MPTIDLKSSHEFWKNYEDPMIYRVIAFMETVENWTLDGHPQLEAAMDRFGQALDNVKKFELGKEAELIQLGCYLRTSRVLRLLQAIDTIEPGSASKLLMYSEENSLNSTDPASLFLRRNIVFERLRLLGRVFSSDRFSLVLKALENEDDM
jgi:intracellular multiplication protein IcmW